MSRTPGPIHHGTPGGYLAHIRRTGKGTACPSCLQAWADATKKRRQNK
jgi:hypothetical protein